MSGFTASAKDVMLGALRTEITQVSLHSSAPGATGVGELTGGSYARKAVTLTVPAGGAMTVSNAPVFDVPPSATVAHVGFWAGAAFRGSATVVTEVYSAAGGTYTLLNTTQLDLNGV